MLGLSLAIEHLTACLNSFLGAISVLRIQVVIMLMSRCGWFMLLGYCERTAVYLPAKQRLLLALWDDNKLCILSVSAPIL